MCVIINDVTLIKKLWFNRVYRQTLISKDKLALLIFNRTRWLLNYQDDATKLLHWTLLISNRVAEVGFELLKVFNFGAPDVFQSDNGREFTVNVVSKLIVLLPESKIRKRSYKWLNLTAEKILSVANKKLPPIAIVSSVIDTVPKIDRGPLYTQNIIGKVVN